MMRRPVLTDEACAVEREDDRELLQADIMEDLVPLLQAHPTWARDKHEGREFPLLRLSPSGFFPPSRSVSRRPIWAGARSDNLLVGPRDPRGRNADM